MLLQLRGLGEDKDQGVSVNIFDMLYGTDGFGFPDTGSSTPTTEPTQIPSYNAGETPQSNFVQKVTPYVVGAAVLYFGLELLSGGKRAARSIARARRTSQRRAQLKAQLAAL